MAYAEKPVETREKAERKELEYGAVLVKDAGKDRLFVARVSQVPPEGKVEYSISYNYVKKSDFEKARNAGEGNNDANIGTWIHNAVHVWYGAAGTIGAEGTQNEGKLVVTPPKKVKEGDRPKGFRGETLTPGDIKQEAEQVAAAKEEAAVKTRAIEKPAEIKAVPVAETPTRTTKKDEDEPAEKRGTAEVSGTARMLQENGDVKFTYAPREIMLATPKRVKENAEMMAEPKKKAASGESKPKETAEEHKDRKKEIMEEIRNEYEAKYALRYSELRAKESMEGLDREEEKELGTLYDALTSRFKLKATEDGFADKELNRILNERMAKGSKAAPKKAAEKEAPEKKAEETGREGIAVEEKGSVLLTRPDIVKLADDKLKEAGTDIVGAKREILNGLKGMLRDEGIELPERVSGMEIVRDEEGKVAGIRIRQK